MKEEQKGLRLNLNAAFENELKEDQEVLRLNLNNAFENELKEEQKGLRLNLNAAFENELKEEQEELRLNLNAAFENELKEEKKELRLRLNAAFENELKEDQEVLRLNLNNAFENELKEEQKELRVRLNAAFENELKEDQEVLRLNLNNAYENELKREHEEQRVRLNAVFENELKEEHQKSMLKQNREYRKSLILNQNKKTNNDTNTDQIKKQQSEIHSPSETENNVGQERVEDNVVKLEKTENSNAVSGKIWFYEVSDLERPVIMLNGVQLFISLSVKSSESEEELFPVAAPLEMKLGDFFNHFVNLKRKGRNSGIDVLDIDQNPQGWKFYSKGFMQRKELDPELSLHKNKIRERESLLQFVYSIFTILFVYAYTKVVEI